LQCGLTNQLILIPIACLILTLEQAIIGVSLIATEYFSKLATLFNNGQTAKGNDTMQINEMIQSIVETNECNETIEAIDSSIPDADDVQHFQGFNQTLVRVNNVFTHSL